MRTSRLYTCNKLLQIVLHKTRVLEVLMYYDMSSFITFNKKPVFVYVINIFWKNIILDHIVKKL